jgi:hypothetical protein
MMADEVARSFGISRRKLMRGVEAGEYPPPFDTRPLSWTAYAVENFKRTMKEQGNGRIKRRKRTGPKRRNGARPGG